MILAAVIALVLSLLAISVLAAWVRRPNRDVYADQWTYPPAFVAAVVAASSGMFLLSAAVAWLLERR